MKLKKTIITFVISLTAILATISVGLNNDNRQTYVHALSNQDIITTDLSDAQVNAYYTGVSGLTGQTLKEKLNSIIDNHTYFSYASAWEVMKITDRDWDLSPLASPNNYGFDDDPYMNLMYGGYNGDPLTAYKSSASHNTIWNREHTWSKSHGNFGETSPAGTDFHHLRGADQGLNGYHSNYDFGDVGSNAVAKSDERGNPNMAYYGTPVGYSEGTVFEPHDMYKGDVARMIFYMATRYITYSGTGYPMLRIVDDLTGSTTSSSTVYGEFGILSHLLEWNELDPVDDYEIHRNNLIDLNFQHNRNPYVDHPEWARIVYDSTYSGPGATIASETSSVGSSPAWETPDSPLSYITINTAGTKTSYSLNEPLDTSGLIVTAHYEDTTSRVVSTFTTSPTNGTILSSPGSQTITVSYTEGAITDTETYSVSISSSERTLESIALTTTSVQTSFTFAETFNSDNLLVTGYYSDSTSETISSYFVAEPDMESIGTKEVVVSYLGHTDSYEITITNQGAQVGVEYASDLFISEYIEGSGNNKAIEIYNGTGTTVDLSDYTVYLYANGATTPNSTLAMSGTLAHDATIIYYNSSASASISSKPNSYTSSVANFNGNDAIELYKESTTSVIDIIGEKGLDSYWSDDYANGSGDLVDVTVVRIPSIKEPSATFTPSQWNLYPIDTFTYLGDHTCELTGGSDYITQAIAYGTFFLEETAPYCEVLDGGNVDWTYLANEYDYMIDDAKDYFFDDLTTDESIVDAKERYDYLITKYSSLYSSRFIDNSNGVLYNSPLINQPLMTDTDDDNSIALIIMILSISMLGVFSLNKKRVLN